MKHSGNRYLVGFLSPCAPYLLVLGLIARAMTPATAAEPPGAELGGLGNGKFTIGPEYKTDPDLTDQGNPKGKSFEFSMPLAESKIFRGDDSTLEPEKKPVRK